MLKATSSPDIRQSLPQARLSRPASAPGTPHEASLRAEEAAVSHWGEHECSPGALLPTTRNITFRRDRHDSAALIRILKDRKLTVHGAHIVHIGAPVILLLASAYASDKITRNVFFNTLDALMRRIRARSTKLRSLHSEQLVALGLSKTAATKVPVGGFVQDRWTIVGLISGLTDIRDFELLCDPNKKGEFFKRHFDKMTGSSVSTNGAPPFRNWNPDSLLLETPLTYKTAEFQSEVRGACEYLERGVAGDAYYDPWGHIRLRLAAASINDHHLDIIGPFASIADMEATFKDIFRVVEPDYEPELFSDLDNFHFEEPAEVQTPPRKADAFKSEGDSRRVDKNRVNRDATALGKFGTGLAVQAGGTAERSGRRDANGSRPPSCVIV